MQKATKETILKSLQEHAKQARMRKCETVSAVVLDKEEWTPDNGMVTPAGKVQRRKVLEKFKKEVGEAWGSE